MSTVKKSKSNRPSATQKGTTPAHSLTPAEAYAFFLPDAQKIPELEVVSCRGDLPLALHNVQLGVDSVMPHEERLRKEMPTLNLAEMQSLPDLATGLMYAADRQPGPPSKIQISRKLARLRQLREPMLLVAEGLALHGLLPPERVSAIRHGKGPIDTARGGIGLESLYREHEEALKNKQPFSAAELKEVADLGNDVVRGITPDGGRQRVEAKTPETVLRDRFYTLLTRRHAELRKAGYFLYGEAVNDYVPALATRVLRPRKSAAEAPESPPEPAHS